MENNEQLYDVYIQSNDRIYHLNPTCAGAGFMTVNNMVANKQGRSPCSICATKDINANAIGCTLATSFIETRQYNDIKPEYSSIPPQPQYQTTDTANALSQKPQKQSFMQALKEQVNGIMPKGSCFICHQETPFQCADDYICANCIKNKLPYKVGLSAPKLTKEEIESYLNTGNLQSNAYIKALWKPTKKVRNYFEIDETTNRWVIPSNKYIKAYSFDDVIGFELIEDGSSIIKGGVGMAAVGAAVFGALGGTAAIGAGATVGSILGKKKNNRITNELKVKITVNDIDASTLYIILINKKTKCNTTPYKEAYKYAQEILSILSIMVDRKAKAEVAQPSQSTTIVQQATAISPADEIKKYKLLLDDGAITQEEFDTKKKELLGL